MLMSSWRVQVRDEKDRTRKIGRSQHAPALCCGWQTQLVTGQRRMGAVPACATPGVDRLFADAEVVGDLETFFPAATQSRTRRRNSGR